ncbi:MAG: Uncharacterised protein [Candidatus Poseidoniaceae archaeon]|nr:MAG: Uncharacterised protein [Candidatus Poseidoniaceae archaeon]
MHIIDADDLETVSHEHDLIRCNAVGAMTPLNVLNCTKMRAMSYNSGFCNTVGFPCQQMAATDASDAVIGSTNTLQHAIDGSWTLQLHDFSNRANVDT